jgi:F-type H+-transporting ATPase subunit a
MAGHGDDFFHHVRDSQVFELPQFLGGELLLPKIGDWQLTKFMVLQTVAAVFVLWVFRGLAKRIASGEPAEGAWWNFWESMALFIRDEVVRPTIGEGHHDGHGHEGDDHHGGHGHHGHAKIAVAGHPADKYLPYVWSCFFYVLICNLLGAFPWMGSATGHIWVTAVLGVWTLVVVIFYGSCELGFMGFWKALCPPMELPFVLKIGLVPMIWVIELVGLLIKHGVLAVRLFANIMAGHTVIATILGFIAVVGHSDLVYLVAPASVFGQVAIGMLELFVAFLQAYIFAFLAALFIGTAVHPH